MLARTMGMTVAELDQRMSGEEFLDHLADYSLAPWGEEREDIRRAAQMVITAAAQGGKLTRRQAYDSISMDGEKREQEDMTDAQIKGVLGMWK